MLFDDPVAALPLFAMVAAVISILIVAWQYRATALREVSIARKRIASDLHVQLGIHLSGIALSLEVAIHKRESSGSESPDLHMIAQDVRNLISNLPEIVGIIDSGKEDLRNLVKRMEHVSQRLFKEGLTLTTPDDHALPLSALPMEFRRHVLLIFKEALYNVVRHATATRVEVTIDYVDDMFSFRITDDGKGFDPETVWVGRGMRTLQRRAATVGGELVIHSTEEGGTMVRFSVRIA